MSMRDSSNLVNVQTTASPITVMLPDGTTAISTHTALLNVPSLPLSCRLVHIFPHWHGPLLSIGLLCDAGMIAIYTAANVLILDSAGNLVLHGSRSLVDKIWLIDVSGPPPVATIRPTTSLLSASVITEARGTQAQIVAYYHATMGSPSISTLEDALNRQFVQLPGLTLEMLRKYPPSSVATAKGHMDQFRQGMRSTKSTPSVGEDISDTHPPVVPRTSNVEIVYTKLFSPDDFRHTDLTGRFPIQAKSGANYVLIMVCCNYIHAETLRSRDAPEYVKAYSRGTDFFATHGITPQYERLDNETSKLLEKYCANHSPPIKIQYVPPNNHRASKAERGIRTWKNHFIAMLCTVDPAFAMDAWDLLIPQAELTLNLMRSSSFCPHTSAWHSLHGPYNFDHEPIAPPGMRIVCFEAPSQRSTWSPHGIDGFYVGPAMNHHRCFTVYIPSTHATRITGQLSWHPPPAYQLPGSTPADDVLSCISRLQASIEHLAQQHPHTHGTAQALGPSLPSLTLAIDHLSALLNPPPVDPVPALPPRRPSLPPLLLHRRPPHLRG